MIDKNANCPHESTLDDLRDMMVRVEGKVDLLDLALRGDGRAEVGIVEHVRDLKSWREEQESKAAKLESDGRSIKTAVVGAVVLWLIGAVGVAVVAGAKSLGWNILDGGK